MSTTVLSGFSLNIKEIEQARKGRVTQHQCATLAGKIKFLSNRVGKSWFELPEEEKQAFKSLAYSLTQPRRPNVLSSAKFAYVMFRAHQGGYSQGIQMLAEAIDELIDNVFSAVEREDLAEAFADFAPHDYGAVSQEFVGK